jgi:TonB family protein
MRPVVRLLLLHARTVRELGQMQEEAGAYRTALEVYERGLPRDELFDTLRAEIDGRSGRKLVPGGARSRPEGSYLSAVHDRLHPIFVNTFLRSFNQGARTLPPDRDLRAVVEIDVTAATGEVRDVRILQTSGVETFDLAAVSSVRSAAPFGPAPQVGVPVHDGTVRLHWEFHRDESVACTTYNARTIAPGLAGL